MAGMPEIRCIPAFTFCIADIYGAHRFRDHDSYYIYCDSNYLETFFRPAAYRVPAKVEFARVLRNSLSGKEN
jgi:hypothetical protein